MAAFFFNLWVKESTPYLHPLLLNGQLRCCVDRVGKLRGGDGRWDSGKWADGRTKQRQKRRPHRTANVRLDANRAPDSERETRRVNAAGETGNRDWTPEMPILKGLKPPNFQTVKS